MIMFFQGLKLGLQQILPLKNSTKLSGKPPEIEKRLCVSLMLTLGEWCMNLPVQVLLMTSETHRTPVLSAVFEEIGRASCRERV